MSVDFFFEQEWVIVGIKSFATECDPHELIENLISHNCTAHNGEFSPKRSSYVSAVGLAAYTQCKSRPMVSMVTMGPWTHGFYWKSRWTHGFLDPWSHGLDPTAKPAWIWTHGFQEPWFYAVINSYIFPSRYHFWCQILRETFKQTL